MDILKSNPDRFVYSPIQHTDLHEMYQKAVASFWTPKEIDFTRQDDTDWDSFDTTEKEYILKILGFFAASDGIVIENLVSNFCAEVQIPEARAFYTFQAAMEQIHSETYAILLEKFGGSDEEVHERLHAVQNDPCTRAKAEWALEHISKTEYVTDEERLVDFSKRCLAFACVEGIQFSSSFAALFWLKKKGKCPGITFSNELISRDEGLHRDFALLVLSKLPPLPRETILEIVISAAELEVDFVHSSLSTALMGMNASSMTQYVHFIADHLLTSMGQKPYYNEKNPFEWMDSISLNGKTNFFEKRVGEYSKARVGTEDVAFTIDAAF